MLSQVSSLLFNHSSIAVNGRSHLMLNTVKKEERKTKKLLFDRLLKESDMVQNMKEEIIKLKNELKRHQSDAEELDKNKEILADL